MFFHSIHGFDSAWKHRFRHIYGKGQIMDISIRLLKKDELGLIRQIADVVWPVTFAPILSKEQIAYMMQMIYAPEVMDREYDEGVQFRCVFDGEKPIGYITMGPCGSLAGTMKLHKCYLLQEYQGKGIGSMMLKEAMRLAAEQGYRRLRLNVNRNNEKAIRAYTRNGFKTVETVDNPIGGGFFMNDYVMETTLAPARP